MCFSVIRNPYKGATPHASSTTKHNAKQACSEIEKKYIRNFIYSKEQISVLATKFLEDYMSQYWVDSEDCLLHQ